MGLVGNREQNVVLKLVFSVVVFLVNSEVAEIRAAKINSLTQFLIFRKVINYFCFSNIKHFIFINIVNA